MGSIFCKKLLLSIVVCCVIFGVFSAASRSAGALDVPPAPAQAVVDQTGTLSNDQIALLSRTIAEERTKTGNEIAVLLISSLNGDSLEEYSLRVARAWGIGEKDRDNGVLLLVVKNDRKLRIEVGYGLEGALPDARAGQIIRNNITPEFKNGNYFEGIKAGLESIIASIHGEYQSPTGNGMFSKVLWDNIGLIVGWALIVPIWLSSILARSKSWWAGGVVGGAIGVVIGLIAGFVYVGIVATALLVMLGLFIDWSVSSNYRQRKSQGKNPSWWAGGTHLGGGKSGGFSGGSFGGGGASGSW